MCFSLFLLKSDLQWSEDAADILGQGGSGTIIYRAKYRGHPVAIKRFHFKKCKQQSLNSSTGTSHSSTTPALPPKPASIIFRLSRSPHWIRSMSDRRVRDDWLVFLQAHVRSEVKALSFYSSLAAALTDGISC